MLSHIEENKDFFGGDIIKFSSEVLRDKILYNLKLEYKFHTVHQLHELVNYNEHKIFPSYYVDINDFEVKSNEFISTGIENFDKLFEEESEDEGDFEDDISEISYDSDN